MKFSYLFALILACNAVGVITSHRGTKTAMALVSAALAIYGLAKILG
ncbi:MAG: hypothetical protein V4532_18610 [Pseudomonadota bacterium]